MASPKIQLAKSLEKLSAKNLQMLSIIAGLDVANNQASSFA